MSFNIAETQGFFWGGAKLEIPSFTKYLKKLTQDQKAQVVNS